MRNEKTLSEVSVEEFIPHRGRMKLIDEIVSVDEKTAVTESIVKQDWPLFEDNAVSPLTLIELAAQTAGVCIGWKEAIMKGKDTEGRSGWLVGIKQALFYLDRIPINSRIRVRSEKSYSLDNYLEVIGVAKIGPKVIGEVKLQIVHPDLD